MARQGRLVQIAFSLGGGGTALACVSPRVCVRVCVCAVLADHGARGTSCGARVRFVDRVNGRLARCRRMRFARFLVGRGGGTSCGARVRFVDRVYGRSRMHLARFPSGSLSLRASMAAIRLIAGQG